MTWYWQSGSDVGSKKNDRPDCIHHVVAPDGTLWRRWNNDKDWWRFDPKGGVQKGNKFKNKINRLRRKLGV